MAWKTVEYKISSACPLLMHSGQTVDPINKFAKSIKLITGKRKKTDADFEEIARIEFMAGLYLNEQGPILPSFIIEAALIGAAKKNKEGPQAKSGMFCPEHSTLQYEGPRNPDDLWAVNSFRFSMPVRIGQSKVMRMRPIFNKWDAIIKVSYEDSIVNKERIDEWVSTAGTQIGLGDWRPRYGRFNVSS